MQSGVTPPRLLLVQPGAGPSFWGMEYAAELMGARYSNAPLPLLTIGALTPEHWDVRLVDENVESVDLDTPCDVVGITAMNIHAARAFQLADEFRLRGRTVVIGGPFASVQPDLCGPHADAVFIGDAERSWPAFCRDFELGTHRDVYSEPEKVDLRESPVPRYDLVGATDYSCLPVQTTRGCPYMCEFCDVIVIQGRRVRTKPIEQVLAEVDAVRRMGVSEIFFTDDNLIGNLKYTRKLLRALVRMRDETGYKPSLFTQVTLNLAEYPDILELMVRAGFRRIFIGIESPRQDSLLASGKRQNVRGDMLERVATIQRAGIVIWAGMIVGFDQDDVGIFKEQADFLEEAGIAVAMVGMLNAPVTTPLHDRLTRAGRIYDQGDWIDQCAWTNITPARMTRTQLFRGYSELIQELYDSENYTRRVRIGAGRMRPFAGGSGRLIPDARKWGQLWRSFRAFSFSRDPVRRAHLLPNALRIGLRRPAHWVETNVQLGMWSHFETYVPQLATALDEVVASEQRDLSSTCAPDRMVQGVSR